MEDDIVIKWVNKNFNELPLEEQIEENFRKILNKIYWDVKPEKKKLLLEYFGDFRNEKNIKYFGEIK